MANGRQQPPPQQQPQQRQHSEPPLEDLPLSDPRLRYLRSDSSGGGSPTRPAASSQLYHTYGAPRPPSPDNMRSASAPAGVPPLPGRQAASSGSGAGLCYCHTY
jgi:hypothetical protein